MALAVGAVAVAEVVLPASAESTVEERAATRLAPVGEVRADIGTFPVVVQVLAEGQIPSLRVVAEDLRRSGVTFAEMRVDLEGIALARRELLNGNVELERIERGRLTATLTEAELSRQLPGAQVSLSPGRASVAVAGRTVDAELAVSQGALRLALGDLPAVSIPLPSTDLFPCELGARAVEGELRLTCVLDRVPAWLVRELARPA